LAHCSVARTPHGKLVSLVLLGGVALASGGPTVTPAHAQPAPAAQTWLTVDHSVLCQLTIKTNTFIRRCTSKWFLDDEGNIVSNDPSWMVIFPRGATGDALIRPHSSSAAVTALKPSAPKPAAQQPRSASQPVVQITSGAYGLWTPPPGHPAYSLPEFAGDPNAAYYGTCTWYAEYRRPDEPLAKLGNAAQWAWNAPHYGLRVGTSPAVGATVVFQPGVLGAGSGGHVGHVEAVYSGGWFLISEMNMDWNGGGFGRVSYRYVVVMPGVSFVY
jgi:surface antigen